MIFCRRLIFFFKTNFVENYFQEVENSLDPDQVRIYVGSDLDPNCLQRLSADDTSGQRVFNNENTSAVRKDPVSHLPSNGSKVGVVKTVIWSEEKSLVSTDTVCNDFVRHSKY